MKTLFQYISESKAGFKPVKLQCEFTYDPNSSKGVRCFVTFPKGSALPWPEPYEELLKTRCAEGGDLYDSEGKYPKCPQASLKVRLDGSEESELSSRVIWQFDSSGDSWGVISGATNKFPVTKPFSKLELVAVPNNSFGEFVIGTLEPKYPATLTFDLKTRKYSSRIKKGGKFVTVGPDWTPETGEGRKEGVANDVRVMFGKYYGKDISEVCLKDPEYASYLMTISSVGAATANSNLQSCQSYIDKNLDWKAIRDKVKKALDEKAAKALPKGTVIDFEGDCKTVENKYSQAASWLPQSEQDKMNFEYTLIYCNNGMTLRSNKRIKKLTGHVKGTATIDWYSPGSDTYGIVDIVNLKKA